MMRCLLRITFKIFFFYYSTVAHFIWVLDAQNMPQYCTVELDKNTDGENGATEWCTRRSKLWIFYFILGFSFQATILKVHNIFFVVYFFCASCIFCDRYDVPALGCISKTKSLNTGGHNINGIINPFFDGLTFKTSGHFAYCLQFYTTRKISAYSMFNHRLRSMYLTNFVSWGSFFLLPISRWLILSNGILSWLCFWPVCVCIRCQGDQGERGPPGPNGVAGTSGPPGSTGEKGEEGPEGEPVSKNKTTPTPLSLERYLLEAPVIGRVIYESSTTNDN